MLDNVDMKGEQHGEKRESVKLADSRGWRKLHVVDKYFPIRGTPSVLPRYT